MEIVIKMNRNIPEKSELQKFIDYLMITFPLIRTGKVFILIEKTRNLYLKADCGNLCGYECKDGKKVSRMTMKLPKVYTLQRVIVTLAHEYCHSLQSDRSENVHFMGGLSRKEKAAGGNERELEADVFGVKVASEYMNIHPHTLLEELWDVGLYRISKPACAEKFGYVHLKRDGCV
ncbi:MAG: hypothetical protein J0665_14845 [Deltaproteobacteria bacterium]|nr:hypothetical protein [Deltaproteobacteria bacterium]